MLQRRSAQFLACFCAFILVLPGAAQQPAPAKAQTPKAPAKADAAQQEPAPVRVTTRLVQVSVIATRKGQPVTDLKREDFTLLDSKDPQEISNFSLESNATLADAQPLPPNVFSNHLDRQGQRPASITIILFDGLNTRFEDQVSARDQTIKFLQQLKPTDRVALFALGSKLRVLHDFTTDAEPLLRALKAYTSRTSRELDASEVEPADTGSEEIDALLDWANERQQAFFTINRVKRTLDALESIANYLSGFPGRKNLVWVSSAFPFAIGFDRVSTPDNPVMDRQTFGPDMQRAVEALNNAGVAMYPVDARGLATAFSGGFARSGANRAGPSASLGRLGATRNNIDSMQDLAERTGGRAFYNTNDIRGAIRRAIDDSRFTYVLGYYPTHGQWDGKFRKIKLKVSRAGVALRYRQGYFALPERTLDPQLGEAMMRAAAWSPLDATGVGLSVRATRFQAAGSDLLKLELTIDPKDFSLAVAGGRRTGALEYIIIERAADGRTVASPLYRLPIDYTSRSYEQVARQGMTLTRLAEVLPGAEHILVVVRDPNTNSIGSVSFALRSVPTS